MCPAGRRRGREPGGEEGSYPPQAADGDLGHPCDSWDGLFRKEVIQCKTISVTVSGVCTSNTRATDGSAWLVQPESVRRPATVVVAGLFE